MVKIISVAGSEHRAVGVAFLDIGESIASIGSAAFVLSIGGSGVVILLAAFILYTAASITQRKAELQEKELKLSL